MARLPDDIAAFLSGAVSVLVATRDNDLGPWLCRAGAARVGDDGATVTVYVPDRAGASLLAVVSPGRPLAVTATHVPTSRSIQLKGPVTAIRPARDDERGHIDAQARGFTDDLGDYGFPAAVVRRLVTWPATAVEVRIEASFEQTPGPGAGRPLGGA